MDSQYITLISVYAPKLVLDEAIKFSFYEKLWDILESIPRNDKIIKLGLEVTGKPRVIWKDTEQVKYRPTVSYFLHSFIFTLRVHNSSCCRKNMLANTINIKVHIHCNRHHWARVIHFDNRRIPKQMLYYKLLCITWLQHKPKCFRDCLRESLGNLLCKWSWVVKLLLVMGMWRCTIHKSTKIFQEHAIS